MLSTAFERKKNTLRGLQGLMEKSAIVFLVLQHHSFLIKYENI